MLDSSIFLWQLETVQATSIKNIENLFQRIAKEISEIKTPTPFFGFFLFRLGIAAAFSFGQEIGIIFLRRFAGG